MSKPNFARCFWGFFIFIFVAACNDHGLEPASADQGIAGRITYMGAWPDTTDWVRVVVFKKMPASVIDITLNPPIFSDTLPRFVSSYDYKLTVPPGRYEWVVLAWKPKKRFAVSDFSGLDTLGMYALPNDPDAPLAIDVPDGSLLGSIDIQADFARLVPESPLVP